MNFCIYRINCTNEKLIIEKNIENININKVSQNITNL